MSFPRARVALAVAVALVCVVITACRPREDPARTALRTRLSQTASLSPEELGQLRDEVSRGLTGKHVRLKTGDTVNEMSQEERETVLGMLTDPAGMFDEGLKTENGTTYRILNSPGEPLNSEIEASRRLWVDIQTFQPRHFSFNYAFEGYGDYAFDVVVE